MAGNPEPETQNDAESSDRPESAASPVFLRDFSISNFKSLADFEMTGLGQFVCLVGLNGSGKTSVLQALDFLAQLAGGTVRRWLLDKGWTWDDLKTSSLGRDTISFKLNLSTMGNQETFGWEGDYLISQNACAREEIRINGVTFLRVADKVLERAGETTDLKPFDYRGSILAMLSVEYEPYFPVFRIKEFLREMKLLGLLSPEQMRQESGFSEDIGPGGERLPGYLGNLEAKKRAELLESVRVFYPELLGIDTVTTRAGLTTMVFHENYRGPGKDFSGTVTGAWHINDGLLRILTIVAQTQSSQSITLIDEIENGINPELIQRLVNFLTRARRQVIATTHNPLILNYLPDELAKESVVLLYRDDAGNTKAKKFFDIPEMAEKLKILGPGEVFVDTSLELLTAGLLAD